MIDTHDRLQELAAKVSTARGIVLLFPTDFHNHYLTDEQCVALQKMSPAERKDFVHRQNEADKAAYIQGRSRLTLPIGGTMPADKFRLREVDNERFLDTPFAAHKLCECHKDAAALKDFSRKQFASDLAAWKSGDPPQTVRCDC